MFLLFGGKFYIKKIIIIFVTAIMMLITVMQVLDVDKVYVTKPGSKRVAYFCVCHVGLWSSELRTMFICGGNSRRIILEILEQLWWKGK